MNQEEGTPEFKQQRDAEVEKNRKEQREEIFEKDRSASHQMEEEKNVEDPTT